MAALTTFPLVDAGTAPSTASPSASDTAEVGNGHNTFLVYRNTGSSALVVTIVVPGNTSYGQLNPDPAITVPITTGEKWIPLRKEYDAGDGSGRVTITATGVAVGQTVSVVQVG